MRSVLVVGGANYDLTARAVRLPTAGETLLAREFDEQPGGKAANQAVAAAAWGAPTTLLARIGTDIYGERVLARLSGAGVNTSRLIHDPAGTGLGIVFMDLIGMYQTLVVPRANANLAPGDIDLLDDLWQDAGVLVLQLESPPDTVIEAARRAHAHHVPVLLNAAPADQMPTALWEHMTMLVVNEVEAALLSGVEVKDIATAEAALLVLLARVPEVIITLGSEGVIAGNRAGTRIRKQGISVPVVSTLGAGDAFVGVLAAEIADGALLEGAIHQANLAGAAAVMQTETGFVHGRAAVQAMMSAYAAKVAPYTRGERT